MRVKFDSRRRPPAWVGHGPHWFAADTSLVLADIDEAGLKHRAADLMIRNAYSAHIAICTAARHLLSDRRKPRPLRPPGRAGHNAGITHAPAQPDQPSGCSQGDGRGMQGPVE